ALSRSASLAPGGPSPARALRALRCSDAPRPRRPARALSRSASLAPGGPSSARALPALRSNVRAAPAARPRPTPPRLPPPAPAALDVARERDARRLDLARREPAALDGLQAVVAEGERGATPRHALAAALLHLAPLDLLRSEHDGSSHAEGGALLLLLPGQDLAAEDPHLDADDAVGGLR